MKNNRKIVWFLSIVLIGLWATIAYQVMTAINEEEADEKVKDEKPIPGGQTRVVYKYVDNVRDPFKFVNAMPKTARTNLGTKEPEPFVPPSLKLTGIITSDQSKVAVLENPDGSILFLKQGDVAGDVRILEIQGNVVRFSYLKRKGEWSLQEKK